MYVFATEAAGLARTNLHDGFEWRAADTGHCFTYARGVGHLQTLPLGTPGQALTIDAVTGRAQFRSQLVNQAPATATVTGVTVETSLATRTIPGGLLGPNGYLRWQLIGGVTNADVATQNWNFRHYGNGSQVDTLIKQLAAGQSGACFVEGRIFNQSADNVQVSWLSARFEPETKEGMSVQTAPPSIATASDWIFALTVQPSNANLTLAVTKLLIETVYLP